MVETIEVLELPTRNSPMIAEVFAVAFDGQRPRWYRCAVEPNGTVLVYDALVAELWSSTHSLPEDVQDELRQLATRARARVG